jgi:hypothetical protein
MQQPHHQQHQPQYQPQQQHQQHQQHQHQQPVELQAVQFNQVPLPYAFYTGVLVMPAVAARFPALSLLCQQVVSLSLVICADFQALSITLSLHLQLQPLPTFRLRQ